jgi:hypothetical protein
LDIRQLDALANDIRTFREHMLNRHGIDNTGYVVSIALQLLQEVEEERLSLSDHALSLIPGNQLTYPISDRILEATHT